jgi:hypothetical protein
MKKSIFVEPSVFQFEEMSDEEKKVLEQKVIDLYRDENFLTLDQLDQKFPVISAAIGKVFGPLRKFGVVLLLGVAPPEGQNWEGIEGAITNQEPFSLRVLAHGFTRSSSGKREKAIFSYIVGKVEFKKTDRKVKVGDTEVPEYEAVINRESVEVYPLPFEEPSRRAGKDVLTGEEAEELKEEFLEEGKEEEREEISLEELAEEERRAEREEEEREEEELVEQAIARIGESKKLLKHILLSKIAALLERVKTPLLQKAKKKDSDKRDDVEGAKRKLEEGLKALSDGNGLEALEDFAIARFYLFDHDSYTEPLVNAFDDLMDMAWSAYKGRKYSKERAREVAQRILRLIESPRGNRAEPPRRVESPRDARLWEMAKRIVKDEYRDIEEDSERFWQVVSRIFTRMKLRLGGAREEAVEKIVSELREEHGKLPAAGKGSKTAKEVERLKEKHLRSKGS